MGMDKKELKQVKKAKDKIFFNLSEIDKLIQGLSSEGNEREKKKIQDKIQLRKGIITSYSKELGEKGIGLDEDMQELSERQKKILLEIFPQGLDSGLLETQKERDSLINQYKDWINKLKKLREEYPPYDASLPVKQKLKNKIYKQEKDIGWLMLGRSDPNSKIYDPEWNYKEHFATSTEFTQEERDIIEHCIKIGEEYDKYLDERYGFLAEIGESLCGKGEAIKEWGNVTQAKIWTRNQVKNTMPGVLKILYPDRAYGAEELEYESRQLFKRMIQFVADKETLNKCIELRNKVLNEDAMEIKEMRASAASIAANAKGILVKAATGYINKKTELIASEAEARLIYERLSEEIGDERAMFVILYTISEEVMEGFDLIANYSPDELGIS